MQQSSSLRTLMSHDGTERVIGCYMWPNILLGAPDWSDSYSATEVRWRIPVEGREVLVTVNGGLFERPSAEFSDPYRHGPADLKADDLEEKIAFEVLASQDFNQVLCELTLRGVISEPASPVYISAGNLLDDHAVVTVGGGGRESYQERSIYPVMDLLSSMWRMRPSRVGVVDKAVALPYSSRIVNLSTAAPTLAVGAYSSFSRMQFPEALIDAWIVVEQYVDYLWRSYVANPSNLPRRNALDDTRSYTAAVRLEVLGAAGQINPGLRAIIDTARKHRNNLAHGGKVNREASLSSVVALRECLAEFLEADIAWPADNAGVTW